MKQAALFFDIDGTILSSITGEVPESAIEALEKAKANGHLVFINTGRTWCSIPTVIKRLPFDGFLCGCGIKIIYKDKILMNQHLTEEQRIDLLKHANASNIEAIYEGEEDIFFSARVSRHESYESTRRYMNHRGLGLERYLEQGECAFDKLFVYTDELSDTETFFHGIRNYMDIINRGSGTYEVIMKGYNKATAIDYVLEELGISKEHAYAFGDSSNDLTMLQSVPHAIVMKDHDSVLDPYAEFVTKKVEQDGIAYAMKHYGLI